MSVHAILLALLGLFAIGFLVMWIPELSRRGDFTWPKPLEVAIGFVTNFFDTLGIGSFAPTTSVFKFLKLVPDERIPGTLNVGHTLPTITEALLFIAVVAVAAKTLVLLIVAAIVGAWLGAGVVAKWPRRNIQVGMGIALAVAACIFVLQLVHRLPSGGDALALGGTKLWIGVAGNFVLGALMTLGIGLYAPAMIMISLLGMDPHAAWPIMMGSCAFLMPIASGRFVRHDAYTVRPAIGLAIGGVPGVVLAWKFFQSLPITYVNWLVVIVVLYAAFTMLRSAIAERRTQAAVGAGAVVPE
jgi:uncharacterized membrane protein YfcA